MSKNFYVNQEGEVFLVVTKDVAKNIFSDCKDKSVYLIRAGEVVRKAEEKGDIKKHDGEYGVFVGHLKDILKERKDLFPSLLSIAKFYSETGHFPWGIKSLVSARGWFNVKRYGYRYVIIDSTTHSELRFRLDGGIELSNNEQKEDE